MGIGSNLKASVLGPTKAALLVRNLSKEVEKKPSEKLTGAGPGGAGALGGKTGLAADLNNVTSLAGDISSMLPDMGGAYDSEKVKAAATKSGYHYFEFQYNPESISLSTQAGSYMSRQGAPESGINEIKMTNIPANTSLNLKTCFYQINRFDAFGFDKIQATYSTIGSVGNIVNGVQAFTQTYSVQKEVDGLVSLLTQAATRHVIFIYGEMVFKGELEYVNAQYTMFSPEGNPIAAVVDMSIRQQSMNEIPGSKGPDGEEIPAMKIYDEGYWTEAFTNFLGKPGEDIEVDARPISQKAGSLINLNQ